MQPRVVGQAISGLLQQLVREGSVLGVELFIVRVAGLILRRLVVVVNFLLEQQGAELLFRFLLLDCTSLRGQLLLLRCE